MRGNNMAFDFTVEEEIFALELGWYLGRHKAEDYIIVVTDMHSYYIARLMLIKDGQHTPTNIHYECESLSRVQTAIPHSYFKWVTRKRYDPKDLVGIWQSIYYIE